MRVSIADESEARAEPFGDADEAAAALDAVAAQEPDAEVRTTLVRARLTLRRLEQRAELAEAQSLRDPLTNLANRRAWGEALHTETERARRDRRGAALVVIDLDHFKTYNDTYGHLAGDLLLRRVAETLSEVARTNDIVARVGGDEFAVIAVGADDSAAVGDRVRSALEAAGIAASIGVAGIDPDGDLAEAWSQADRAMYQQKLGQHESNGAAQHD